MAHFPRIGWLFENRRPAQTIAKNAFWLFAGQTASRLLRAAIVIYAARALGAASWGAFSYALGIATFLTTFSDIGVNALLTKETTRNPALKNQYVATAFFTKLGLLSVAVLGVVFFFPYLTNIEEAARLMPILMFVFVFDTLRDLGSALSRALEKMEIEAGMQIFANLMIVLLGFAFLIARRSSGSLAYAYALGSGFGCVAMAYTLRAHFGGFRENFRKELVKPILKTAWPFGLLGLLGIIMLNTDIIMLGWLRSPEDVGRYAAAQKLIQLLYVLPTLLATSTFPLMSRLAKHDAPAAASLLGKTVALSFLFAVPFAALGIALARPIITLLFGAEYIAAITTFRILVSTIIIVYPSILIGNAIFAFDKQKRFITFVFVATFTNIVLNALLITPFGIEGAAISTLLTQLATNILIWRTVHAVGHLDIMRHIKTYLRIGAHPATENK